MLNRSKAEFPGFYLTLANESYMLSFSKRLSELLIFWRRLRYRFRLIYGRLFCVSTVVSKFDQQANTFFIIEGWRSFSCQIVIDKKKIMLYLPF